VTQNGSNTGVWRSVGSGVSNTSDSVDTSLSVSSGDRIGVRLTCGGTSWGGGSIKVTVRVRLTL
jgi:hypothetical protein